MQKTTVAKTDRNHADWFVVDASQETLGRMAADKLKVDGGMSANNRFLQRLSDICDVPVVRHPVVRLVRTRIGPIADPSLAAGQWRELDPAEVRALYAASGDEAPEKGAGRPPRRR